MRSMPLTDKDRIEIRPRDWIPIQFVGFTIGGILGLLMGTLVELHLWHATIYGAFSGLFTTLSASLYISLLHRLILPRLPQSWWYASGLAGSFLAGFFGPLFGYGLLFFWIPIAFLEVHLLKIALASGIVSAMIGLILHTLLTRRNERDHLAHTLTESRLRSLEAQINPHFLFNALNSISELIHQNPHQAESTLLNLSGFLREGMEEKSLIPLERELKTVQRFIDISNVRFGGIIALHTEVEADSTAWMIPKFSIQLLVENAIKHGLESPRPLHITIRTVNQEKRAMITVEDNGKGYNTFQPGHGLLNLQERLRILLEGELTSESHAGKTNFTMTFRKQTDEDSTDR